jgi:hypothetical protein
MIDALSLPKIGSSPSALPPPGHWAIDLPNAVNEKFVFGLSRRLQARWAA